MFNIDQLRLDIEALIRDNPDLVEDEELRANMVEAETDLYSALASIYNAAADAKAKMAAMSERINDLDLRRARFSHRVDALRGLMLKLMQAADLRSIELADATLVQRMSQQQVIGTVDPADLPDDLVRVRREPNKTAIREALLAHREIPGVTLSNAAPTLTVKVK